MKLYLATSNKQKLEDVRRSISPLGYEVEMVTIDFNEGRSEDPKEIALDKAQQAWAEIKKPVIVEDSGFFIEALGGFPMTHIKFSLQTIGVENVLKMMKGETNRKAEWRSTAAYIDKRGVETFTSVFSGTISTKIGKQNHPTRSDYWKIWIPEKHNPENLTWAEMEGEYLEKLEKYWEENNPFVPLASWLKENRS